MKYKTTRTSSKIIHHLLVYNLKAKQHFQMFPFFGKDDILVSLPQLQAFEEMPEQVNEVVYSSLENAMMQAAKHQVQSLVPTKTMSSHTTANPTSRVSSPRQWDQPFSNGRGGGVTKGYFHYQLKSCSLKTESHHLHMIQTICIIYIRNSGIYSVMKVFFFTVHYDRTCPAL